MVASKSGKSRDCDLIIADDIEDFGSTAQPSGRAILKRWWTTTLSSVESHTSVVVKGSRQHADDLYNSLLDNNAWENIVEQVHSDSCVEDPDNFELHEDCSYGKKTTTNGYINKKKHLQLQVVQFMKWCISI